MKVDIAHKCTHSNEYTLQIVHATEICITKSHLLFVYVKNFLYLCGVNTQFYRVFFLAAQRKEFY